MTILAGLDLDSGVGSTAPSELMDPVDRDTDFVNSQEEANLDPGLGSGISPRNSHSEMRNGGGVAYPKLHHALPQRSATDSTPSKRSDIHVLASASDHILPHNLISMVSSSTANASSSSIAVGGNEE